MKERTAEEMLRQAIGQRVKRLRTGRNLTQTQLGARAGREQGTISRIESGDFPSLTVALLLDLAYALECEPQDLCEWPIGIMQVVSHDPGRIRWAEPETVAS